MRLPWMRLSVPGLMALVALLAVMLWVDESSGRREHCREFARWHARGADEYRRNAAGSVLMLQIADWHEHMRVKFERAARLPWMPIPESRAFPPCKPVNPSTPPPTPAPPFKPVPAQTWDQSTGLPHDLPGRTFRPLP